MNWELFKEYTKEGWINFYTKWKNAPLWMWIAQITYLLSFIFYLVLASNGIVYFGEHAEVTPINEMVFFFLMFSAVFGLFVWQIIVLKIIHVILRMLNIKTAAEENKNKE